MMDNDMDVSMDDDDEHDENGGQISPLPLVNNPAEDSDDDRTQSSNSSQFTSYGEEMEDALGSSPNYEHDENKVPLVVRSAPVDLPTESRLKIRVNALHVTAEWKWADVGDDSCGICRMPFEACCVECSVPGDSCPLVVGVCKHPFHMHCITKWTESQNTAKPQCPLCRQEWRFPVMKHGETEIATVGSGS